MSIIQRVPWSFVCQHCGLHGEIRYPNGEKSKLLVTKRQAREFVVTMTGVTLQADEAKVLIEQINKSSLLERDDRAECMADQVSEIELKTKSGCRHS